MEVNELTLISAIEARDMALDGARSSIKKTIDKIQAKIIEQCKAGDFMIEYGNDEIMSNPFIREHIIGILNDKGYKVYEEYPGKIRISW